MISIVQGEVSKTNEKFHYPLGPGGGGPEDPKLRKSLNALKWAFKRVGTNNCEQILRVARAQFVKN